MGISPLWTKKDPRAKFYNRPHWAHIGCKPPEALEECLKSSGVQYERATNNSFFVYYNDEENATLMVYFRLAGILSKVDLINWSGDEHD